MDRAAAEGRGLDWFRAEFRAIVARHGWTGWTGEGTVKGEAWRTRTIWRTNLATSYAAGRRAQLEAGGFRLWVYRHGGSREPRPQHLAWDGLALPPDHPFWATHSPPNGWGCSCYVVGANTPAGVRRVGGDPDKRLPEGWNRPDPRTGTPAGIDRGWAYAPGASATAAIRAMVQTKLAQLPAQIAQAAAKALVDRQGPAAPVPTTWQEAREIGRPALDDILATTVAGEEYLREAIARSATSYEYERIGMSLSDAIGMRLRALRPMGGVEVAVAGKVPGQLERTMRTVASVLPADWVRAANAVPVAVRWTYGRAGYAFRETPPAIVATADSAALHEYLHHVQAVVPGLDDIFRALHAARTAGEDVVPVNGPGELGRRDRYYVPYQGREYPGLGAAEVLTMALQPLLGWDRKSWMLLGLMAKEDPDMLAIALGILMRWTPGETP